jgi:hypothetical protein
MKTDPETASEPVKNQEQRNELLGFYALLDEIRKRPGLYLGQKSFQNLAPWLQGYFVGKEQAGAFVTEEELEFRDFDDFVQEKYDWHDVGGWAAKIQYHHRDDASAFEEFFRLLDEFKVQKRENSIST